LVRTGTIGRDEGLRQVTAWVEAYWQEIRTQPLEYRHAA
jgi:hypothetical protein